MKGSHKDTEVPKREGQPCSAFYAPTGVAELHRAILCVKCRWPFGEHDNRVWIEPETQHAFSVKPPMIETVEYRRVDPPDERDRALAQRDDELVRTILRPIRGCATDSQYCDVFDRATAALAAVRKEAVNDAAAAMRDACVEKVREVLKPYELEFRRKTNSATNMVDYTAMALESITLDQVKQKEQS